MFFMIKRISVKKCTPSLRIMTITGWQICLVLTITIGLSQGIYEDQPGLFARNGHLVIKPASDRDITLLVTGKSRFFVNDVNILRALQSAGNGTSADGTFSSDNELTEFRQRIDRISGLMNGRNGIMRRLRMVENRTRLPSANNRLPGLSRRVSQLEAQVQTLVTKLTENNCHNSLCQNGGWCIDLYDSFLCHCPQNWAGSTCTEDVNECAQFANTDLGCQNGATCINTPGSYKCECIGDWQGLHCTKKKADCLTSPPGELCGHGLCVPTSLSPGYTCICEQGWITNGVSPACTVDFNECIASKPQCSKDPEVECINLPGGFTCGACPSGYRGNGFYCSDINECELNNGGCSTSPHVQCINTRGSNHCGSCPSGYEGNGRICTRSGNICSDNRLCNSLATCVEYPNSIVACICPAGYSGNGIGPNGCVPTQMQLNPCASNPCQNGGTCSINGTSFACTCPFGTVQPRCAPERNVCEPNLCQNGGTCRQSYGPSGVQVFRCICPSTFTGNLCLTPTQTCGGVLTNPSGTLKYPRDGSSSYQHNSRCAWLIRTNLTQILNITFTKFKVEHGSPTDCRFDWLQIHDGRSSASHMIGRFCGHKLPNNGSIISTHNSIYLWFRSDNSTAHDGFELTWNSIDPICGGDINAVSYGLITSPGSPGNYPANRDCFWSIVASPGKRIQLHFFTFKLEVHATCAFDYLEIYAGDLKDNQLLGKFCNTSHPEPITSPGEALTLHFHSDEDSSDAGFQIHYTVVEGIPGCGGKFTFDRGEFGSPVVDEAYPPNLECDYMIELPIGTKINLIFKQFNLEGHSSCNFDSLSIYEKENGDWKLEGKFCGENTPPEYNSQGNILLLKFKSDWSFGKLGFRVAYRALCGGVFTDETGVIKSPDYPKPYKQETTCNYHIEVPNGNVILLDFLDFDLEDNSSDDCYYDSLKVYDGPESKPTLIKSLCGTQIPERQVSSSNHMHLAFSSDSSIAGRGFMANYSVTAIDCGGIINMENSTIHPPMEEDGEDYKPLISCTWIVVAPKDKIIQLSWNSFDLESSETCSYDNLTIYDNSTTHGGLIGKYCGSKMPPLLLSKENIMTLTFKSDNSMNTGGFEAVVHFIDSTKLCGGSYFTPSGVIVSPGWPEYYGSNKHCNWIINAPPNQQIELNVKSFNIESHNLCIFDSLTIRNGGTENSPLIGKFCGNVIPSKLRSFGNQMFITFTSDHSKNGAGFDLEWSSTSTGCGGNLITHEGSIVSPQYPESYAENAQCNWRISVNEGSTIEVTITDLDLEVSSDCGFDFLEIFDGRDPSVRSFGKLCETPKQPFVFNTTTNNAYVRFVSDTSGNGRGFNLNYKTVCNRQITGTRGIVESPGFPYSYPHSVECAWTIKVPRGNKVHLEFSHFDLEQSLNDAEKTNRCIDRLTLSQMQNDQTISEKTYCTTNPGSLTTAGDTVIITFITDVSLDGQGFRVEWNAEGCGDILTRDIGDFSSPNYPNVYSKNTDCEWSIITSFGNSIELTLQNIDFTAAQSCEDNKLTFGDKNENSSLITTICGYEKSPKVITSRGHEMVVKFSTGNNVPRTGFFATYKVTPLKCGGVLEVSNGVITSPNYPQNYDSNDYCEWVIRTTPLHTLELSLLDLDLESSENCIHDVLEIYDGNTKDSSRRLFQNCDNNLPNDTKLTYFTSTGAEMFVLFKSDYSIEAKGFKISYKTACGAKIITNETGIISMASIHDMRDCTWQIISENPAQHVTLTVTNFNNPIVENDRHIFLLKIFDGDSITAPLRYEYSGGASPHALVSNGNAFTVQLTRNINTTTIVGTIFDAHYSVLDTACGGELNSLHGSFASPSYPNSYPRDVECTWRIRIADGNRALLNFQSMDIKSSTSDCNDDYLEIREESISGKILGLYCDNNIPTNLTDVKSLWIKFRSSSINPGKGFIVEYGYLPVVELNDPNGVITSPKYPLSLAHESHISYRIFVEFGSKILLEFKSFNIEYNSKLTVFDGYNMESPALNEKLYGFETPTAILSSSNVVLIVFENAKNSNSKFKVEWSKMLKSYTLATNETANITCGNMSPILVSASGFNLSNISSPGYPYGYDNNLNCTWILASAQPEHHVVLTLDDIDLEEAAMCLADSVIISASRDLQTWNTLDRLCALDPMKMSFYHGTPYLKINFIADVLLNKTGFHGLTSIECGSVMTSANGVIDMSNSVPFRPLSFGGDCTWEIMVRAGRKIRFTFDSFTIKKNSDALCEGYILLRDGIDQHSPFLGDGKYCGETIPRIPMTTSNRAYITYNYGHLVSGKFKLRYEEVSRECGGSTTMSEAFNQTEITSPNYPNIPHPHTECVWTFLVPSGERLKLEFVERFDFTRSPTCEKEFVEVQDGGTQGSIIMGKFCKTLPSALVTTSNMLRVRFFTDVMDPKNGFKAKISLASCGGIYRSPSGTVRSPNYPGLGAYPSRSVCEYRLIGTQGSRMNINFQAMDLPSYEVCNETDHVEIYSLVPNDVDEENHNEILLGSYCSSTIPPTIQSSGNRVLIRFITLEQSHYYRGFLLSYNSTKEKCGGNIEAASGDIASIGYPLGILSRRFCEWFITVPKGRRVKIEFIDFDLKTDLQLMNQRIGFYNDHKYTNRIKFLKGNEEPVPVYSSDNTMLITFWVRVPSSNRGFKIHFSSDEISPCVGDLTRSEGTISEPDNLERYVCIYDRAATSFFADSPGVGTMALAFTNLRMRSIFSVSCGISGTRLTAAWLGGQQGGKSYLATMCGNSTKDTIVRSPFPDIRIEAKKHMSFLNMSYTIDYRLHRCGGVFRDIGELEVSVPNNFSSSYGQLDCAWMIQANDVSAVTLLITDLRLSGRCDEESVSVYNGELPTSPLLATFCENETNKTIISEQNSLFIEYHAKQYNPNSRVVLKLIGTNSVCGGRITQSTLPIASPSVDGKYPPNTECIWELQAREGFHIGLIFIDRFNIEDSVNCTNDYLQVSDYRPGEGFIELGRYCGRTMPPSLNSTGSRMQIRFQTNDKINGDGFKMTWNSNCGGIYNVTENVQTLVSPNYPNNYQRLVKCNYTFIAPANKFISLDFVDFQLEDSRRCRFDNVTIYNLAEYVEPIEWRTVGTYCGIRKPPAMKRKHKAAIVFQSDRIAERRGFKLEYSINMCGGNVTNTTYVSIGHDTDTDTYNSETNCFWNITAPVNYTIVIRFEKFEMQNTFECYFTYAEIYRGFEKDNSKRQAKLCGNMTEPLPVVTVSEEKALLHFHSELFDGNFKALVMFVKNCDRIIALNDTYELNMLFEKYDNLMDCHFLVTAPEGKTVSVTFPQFHLSPCPAAGGKNRSTCDFLEIRDGGGAFADLIGIFAGHEKPLDQSSSRRKMWLRFATNSMDTSTGFIANFRAIATLCGPNTIEIKDNETLLLKSPNYPGYPPNAKCFWTVKGPHGSIIDIDFKQFEIEDTTVDGSCTNDVLEIVDNSIDLNVLEGYGENTVFDGRKSSIYTPSMYLGLRQPVARHEFCGVGKPDDYYSGTNIVHIRFKSNNAIEKDGFTLGLRVLDVCERPFNGLQGRIYSPGTKACGISITVPANYTISLYINAIMFFDNDCAQTSLSVYDGGKTGELAAKMCGYATFPPIFSKTNQLYLNLSTSSIFETINNFDITYLATDKGRGCGGKLFNYGGSFTSPMYPMNVRNNSDCFWEVTVPTNLVVALKFEVFDMGSQSTCETNFVQFIEKTGDKDNVVRRFCGEDDPAIFVSSRNTVTVRFLQTVNFGGTGWKITFMGIHKDAATTNF